MRVFVLTGCASLLLCGAGIASAQPSSSNRDIPQPASEGEGADTDMDTDAQPSDETGAYGGGQTGTVGGSETEPAATTSTKAVPIFDSKTYSITAGGGVVSYTNNDANDFIDTGGAYQVRAAVGTRSIVGFELAYVGSANDVEALGLDPDATLLGNGVEGAVRFNFTVSKWQPYLLAGAVWKRYVVVNDDFNTSATVNNSDGVFEVPLAAGLTWHAKERGEDGLVVDGRFDYRLAGGSDLLGGSDGGGPGLENWQATLKAGWEF